MSQEFFQFFENLHGVAGVVTYCHSHEDGNPVRSSVSFGIFRVGLETRWVIR